MINYLLSVFIIVAAVSGFLGYKFTASPEPAIVAKEAPASTAELPEGFPQELITDKQSQNLTVSVDGNQTTVVYASNLKPEELFDQFSASLEIIGGKITSQAESDFQIQAKAGIRPHETVEVWFTKISDTTTRVLIKYQKQQ